jgi:membrane-associated phospholipid phosphatase
MAAAVAAGAFLASPVVRAQDAVPAAPAPAQPKASNDTPRAPTGEELDRYDFGPNVVCPYCSVTPLHPHGVTGLHWHDHWRRVGAAEYIATPVLFSVAAGVEFLVPKQKHPTWTGAILFDRPAHAWLDQQSQTARSTTATVSDVLFGVSVAYPILVDDLLVSWGLRHSPDVTWQMFVIDSQSYALTLALNSATKRLAGRERPSGEDCRHDDPTAPCNASGTFQSFYSGHAAVTATSAGLMCAHHTQLMLYRNAAADTATCVTAIAFAATTDVLRITSANHWASDVLAGSAMGFLSGYLLPTLLYYKEFRSAPQAPDEQPSTGPTLAVLPLAGPDSLGVSALGLF